MSERPPSVDEDTRGIVDPAAMREHVTLRRHPVGPELEGLVEFFWTVAYAVPPGEVYRQQIITHPCVNVSVGHGQAGDDGRPAGLEARVTGVTRELYTRSLAGTGWAVALKSTPGGFGAFVDRPVSELSERVVPVGEVLDLDEAGLVAAVAGGATEEERVALLARRLTSVLERADPERRSGALEVAAVARLAEHDRTLRRLDDLAEAAGIGVRTLQRLFAEYAGTSPSWMLRRYRLLDAAETVRDGRPVVWAEVAAELGYSDQAHLGREFRAVVGRTPAAYAAAQYGA